MPQGMDSKGKLKGVVRHNHEWNRLIQDKANKDTARTQSYMDKMGVDDSMFATKEADAVKMAHHGKVRAEVSKELGDRGWGRNEFEVAKTRERHRR